MDLFRYYQRTSCPDGSGRGRGYGCPCCRMYAKPEKHKKYSRRLARRRFKQSVLYLEE